MVDPPFCATPVPAGRGDIDVMREYRASGKHLASNWRRIDQTRTMMSGNGNITPIEWRKRCCNGKCERGRFEVAITG